MRQWRGVVMRFVETPAFTRLIGDLLTAEEYRGLQLALRPDQATTLGSSASGSGGVRVKQRDFGRLTTSVREAGAVRRGRMRPGRVTVFRPADVRAVRRKLGKSQTQFALMIGVSVGTLRNWEQGRRRPDGPAMALLRVASLRPKAVAEALSA
jgi:putative transcriptional regulator